MILVTGGTGLLGARVLHDLIIAGKNVRALRRSSSADYIIDMVFAGNESLKKKIEWIEGDVTNVMDVNESLIGIDEVYHCAAEVSFLKSDYRQMMKINVEGTANMVNASLDVGIKKFCHVSSIAALGRVEESMTMNENVFWKASKHNSSYAISKYNAEREVWRAMEEGLNAVIVNPSVIIGPGDWKTGSSAMFTQVWKGMKYYSEGVNGFVDARDVSRSMIALMEKNISGQRFIISEGNYSYREVLNEIALNLKMPAPSVKVNALLSEAAWRAEGVRSFFLKRKPFITKETARNSQRKWIYSNEKIKHVTGINFIPLHQSIADSAKIFLKQFS